MATPDAMTGWALESIRYFKKLSSLLIHYELKPKLISL
jgi:hypothetical protein